MIHLRGTDGSSNIIAKIQTVKANIREIAVSV